MRWLFEYQHLALETALALFEKRSKPMSKKFCLQIIQQSPQVLLTLLNLLCETRPPFHLTLANDGLSARILVHLMALPLGWVPGLDVTSSYIEKTDMEEWDAAIQCNNILWSRPEALQRIITMRTKVCEEDIASITIKLLTSRHSKTKFDDVRSVFRNRGTLLVANLRLLINFTYLDDNPVPFLLALLPFSYWACIRKIKGEAPLGDTETENSIKESVKEEREYEIITSNMAPGNKSGHFVTSYVAPTSVLAPTLLFRVLLRLSKVGYGLENLQTMRTRPPNMPDHAFIGSLVHIHQTVDSKIMGKLIRLSIDRRVSEHRELAKERVLVGGSVENAVAAATYVSAAELALAHIGYGSSSGNRALPVVQQNWRTFAQAKKEVILCLGNAAEAAGRVGKWSMSKKFSTVAVDFCNTVTEDEAKMADCDVQSLKAKNQRRYSFAIQQLQ
ncbi:hypothetical protein FRC02_010561 [Tulasnella sp. 418]|nr:hypothetical protein FRC02_010561 [Tulasnella sp. 418]